MYQWLARKLIRRSIRMHQQGDVDGLLKTFADDVHFTFPGNNSWATDVRGRVAVEGWLRRFHRVGLQIDFDDVLIAGTPWNTRVCMHFTDHLHDPDGTLVYENTGVIYGRAAWGKIVEYTVYEDTEKVAALDGYLAVHEPTSA